MTSQIRITDDNDREFPNLFGVFKREFPIVMRTARTVPSFVEYHGVRYLVAPVQEAKD